MKKVKRALEPCCWLCGRNGTQDPLDKHHIFGGPFRQKSELYGLYVPLCHFRCHESGTKAVHQNRETARELHQYGQRLVMEEQGWTTENFIREFGKNYLDPEEEEQEPASQTPETTEPRCGGGFRRIKEALLPF